MGRVHNTNGQVGSENVVSVRILDLFVAGYVRPAFQNPYPFT